MSYTPVTITGPLLPDGEILGGTMHAQYTGDLYNPDGGLIVGSPSGVEIAVPIARGGGFRLPLVAGDDPGTGPDGVGVRLTATLCTRRGEAKFGPVIYQLTADMAPAIAIGALQPASGTPVYTYATAAQLTTETQAREAGDTANAAAITAEATARTEADQDLETLIGTVNESLDAEAAARQASDEEIHQVIDNLSTAPSGPAGGDFTGSTYPAPLLFLPFGRDFPFAYGTGTVLLDRTTRHPMRLAVDNGDTVWEDLNVDYNYPSPANPGNIVALGDSWTDPNPPGAATVGWVQALLNSTNVYALGHNSAVSGQMAATVVANLNSQLIPYLSTSNTNIVPILMGTNDIGQSGETASTISNNIITTANAVEALLGIPLVMTIPGRADLGTGTPNEIMRNDINSALRDRFGAALLDLDADPNFSHAGAVAGGPYWQDYLHLTDAGYAYLATLILAWLNARYPQGPITALLHSAHIFPLMGISTGANITSASAWNGYGGALTPYGTAPVMQASGAGRFVGPATPSGLHGASLGLSQFTVMVVAAKLGNPDAGSYQTLAQLLGPLFNGMPSGHAGEIGSYLNGEVYSTLTPTLNQRHVFGFTYRAANDVDFWLDGTKIHRTTGSGANPASGYNIGCYEGNLYGANADITASLVYEALTDQQYADRKVYLDSLV